MNTTIFKQNDTNGGHTLKAFWPTFFEYKRCTTTTMRMLTTWTNRKQNDFPKNQPTRHLSSFSKQTTQKKTLFPFFLSRFSLHSLCLFFFPPFSFACCPTSRKTKLKKPSFSSPPKVPQKANQPALLLLLVYLKAKPPCCMRIWPQTWGLAVELALTAWGTLSFSQLVQAPYSSWCVIEARVR